MMADGNVRRSQTPREAGYRMPAEWQPHSSCWLAWPAHAEIWGEALSTARQQFVALCAAIAADSKAAEQLEILVPNSEQEARAKRAMADIERRFRRIRFHRIRYGDIWLRDTGPIFLTDGAGAVASVRFAFNGWGGKYVYSGDQTVARDICYAAGLPEFEFPWVMEGGAVDVDGQGTCLASSDCLLSASRNPKQDHAQMQEHLCHALGVDKVLWLEGSLANDHTDGHVDTLARFVAPGAVLCMKAMDADEPNRQVLERTEEQLRGCSDARGRTLQVHTIPAPGPVCDARGEMVPASYLNFYIGNKTVVVPTWGCRHDRRALQGIAALFPDRQTVGLRANAILEGGGAFHCITVPQPGTLMGVEHAPEA